MSADFQIFLIGLIAIWIFAKSSKLGVLFSLIVIAFANCWLAINVIRNNVQVGLMVVDVYYDKVLDYLDLVHMHISPYLSGYFYGILVGFAIDSGFKLKLDTIKDHVIYQGLIWSLWYLPSTVLGLKRSWNLFPDDFNFVVIAISRNLLPLTAVVSILYVKSVKSCE